MLDKTPVVRVEHLSKHFGSGTARVDALRDINMDVYPGQVVGFDGAERIGQDNVTQLHRLYHGAEQRPPDARRRSGL